MDTKKAAIIYHSKRGTTQKYAAEIAFYLKKKGIESKVTSVQKFNNKDIIDVDYIFLGCWTSGLFFFLQHPEKEWVKFAKSLPENLAAKTALFTTYKIRTGSMFRNMQKQLVGKTLIPECKLQSRDGELSEIHKNLIDKFIE
jgi:flavodoxin